MYCADIPDFSVMYSKSPRAPWYTFAVGTGLYHSQPYPYPIEEGILWCILLFNWCCFAVMDVRTPKRGMSEPRIMRPPTKIECEEKYEWEGRRNENGCIHASFMDV